MEVAWHVGVTQALSDSVSQVALEIIQASKQTGVLLVGAPKTGKTLLMKTILDCRFEDANTAVVWVSTRPKSMFALEQLLLSISSPKCQAVWMDDVQDLFSTPHTALQHKFQVLLLRAMRRAQANRSVLILAACLPEFDAQVLCEMVALKRVRLNNPTHVERVAQIKMSITTTTTNVDSDYIAQRTSGWTRGELNAMFVSNPNINDVDAALAKFRKQTSLFRETAVLHQQEEESGACAASIGGLKKVRALLDKVVVQHFEQDAPATGGIRGILLHGESGNGKTMLGLDLGRQVQQRGLANFFCVKCLDLISKVVGETESNVARMFARARECAPCLLFLDELDALAPKRQDEGDSTSERTFDRVLSVLLVELDGILTKQTTSGRIVIVASTRSPSCLEPALVRAGRLGLHFFIGPADTVEEKVAVLQACTERMPLQVGQEFFTSLATERMKSSETRADIANWCREAAMCALRQDLQGGMVREEHFWNALDLI